MSYVVGIDLGTTNSVVSFVAAEEENARIELLDIPQIRAPGSVEARLHLPSFLYLPPAGEAAGDSLALPWAKRRDYAVGIYAQQRSAETPDRVVASAKSWLSHSGADRTAAVLPWGSEDDAAKLSPVEVTARYLAHIREAWDASQPNHPLKEQEVLLTVPASFDEVARELTVRAARDAELPDVVLLEEPQAAFYSWIDARGDAWRKEVEVGDRILVIDVGGGTTDLSLIAVGERDGSLDLERVAVGDHILLGGDNTDLAVAYRVRNQLQEQGTKLDAWQFRALVQSCREAKESLLADDAGESVAVSILGRGSKVIGGALRVDITRDDVAAAVADGFFPKSKYEAELDQGSAAGLQELGLPYAADPAVTRHIATFLRRHSDGAQELPTALLFNGGVMAASALRRRVTETMRGWGADTRVLDGADPHRAVARGAAYYGIARRGRGVRIRGGTARSFYIGVETSMPAVPGMRPPIKALCVVPQGLEEGSDVELPAREWALTVGQKSEFRFLSSSLRRDDRVGTLLETWEEGEIEELAPLAAQLEWEEQSGTNVPVHLEARVNELGVLELWCVARDADRRWKLELNVRGTS